MNEMHQEIIRGSPEPPLILSRQERKRKGPLRNENIRKRMDPCKLVRACVMNHMPCPGDKDAHSMPCPT